MVDRETRGDELATSLTIDLSGKIHNSVLLVKFVYFVAPVSSP